MRMNKTEKLNALLIEAFWEIYILGWMSAYMKSLTNKWLKIKCLITDFFILSHNNVLNILDNCGEYLNIRRDKINHWRNVGIHHFKEGKIIFNIIELYENYKKMCVAVNLPYIIFDWNYCVKQLQASNKKNIVVPNSVLDEMNEISVLANKNKWRFL